MTEEIEQTQDEQEQVVEEVIAEPQQVAPEQSRKKGFFSKIISFFKGDEKKETEAVVEQTNPQIIKHSECFMCKKPIYEGERWSKQAGRYFHNTKELRCYKTFLSIGYSQKIPEAQKQEETK